MTAGPARAIVLGSSGFIGAAILSRLGRLPGIAATGRRSATLDLLAERADERLAGQLDASTVLISAVRASHDPSDRDALGRETALAETVARAVERGRPARCVLVSTFSVYGAAEAGAPVAESSPLRPDTPYGRAKLAAERAVGEACGRAGTPLLIVRPCKVYGPGDRPGSYGPSSFAAAAARGGSVRVYGDGSERRDHLFVEDLGEAVARLSVSDAEGAVNAASGELRTFSEILAMLEREMGRSLPVERVERDRPKADVVPDPSRLRSLLPGLAPTPLAEGLRATLRYFSGQPRPQDRAPDA